MPSLSQIDSKICDAGWCAMRMALNPASFNIRIRRSSASQNSHAPRTPWSWWMQPPRNSISFSFTKSPFSADHSSLRMPKSNRFSSVLHFAIQVYSFGVSSLHNCTCCSVIFPGSPSYRMWLLSQMETVTASRLSPITSTEITAGLIASVFTRIRSICCFSSTISCTGR